MVLGLGLLPGLLKRYYWCLGLRASDFRGSGFRVRSLRGDLGFGDLELRIQDLEFWVGNSGLGYGVGVIFDANVIVLSSIRSRI